MADDLHLLDEWFGQILAGLDPPQRRRAAMKLGQQLRRANTKRIAANSEPDGSPMEARKPRKDRRGRLRRRQKGKMFKGLRRLRNWRIDTTEDGVEIRPASGAADRVGAVSQFGEVAIVGYLKNRTPIRARYPTRRLLGFSPEDEKAALDVAAAMIEPAD